MSMFITSVEAVLGTDRDVSGPGWKSRRLILAGDGMGYSVHETTVDAGVLLHQNYTDHRETVYCLAGRGTLTDVDGERAVGLGPGSTYSADIGDEHILSCDTEMKFLVIFTPPLEGDETAS